ncbi:IS21 family transposase [Bifidobacterium breve]|uniref:IS21 family transposase n=1 Tax=Bifidobacterium breve TaxID=1685 RepID=UPI003F5AE6B8
MARNRQTAWRVEGYRQEIRDHGGLLPQARGQEGTAFPDRRVFRHGGFVAVRGQAHAPQDRLMPRKQRHTARRVYARLVEEEGFEGSYSSVQRYVRRWREEHRSDGDGYLELDWGAGVMQVAFGEAVATIGGGDVRVHCLVATFPHSNMRYVAATPGENAECVCEGLAQILDHIGMAPRVLVLDNATGAGLRVAWNKVTVVRVFAMFCDHYRLETRSCNPYSGNEKGSVENAVGFLRRNLMAPSPTRRATDS